MTRAYPLALALLLATLTALLLVHLDRDSSGHVASLSRQADAISAQVQEHLGLDLQAAAADLLFLASRPWPADGESPDPGRELLAFIRLKPGIRRIRFLEPDGRERLSIESGDGRPHRTPPGELRNRADEHWFRSAMALPPSSLYLSPLELVLDGGRVRVPLEPTLRLATAASSPRGRRTGLVVLDLDGRRIQDAILRLAADFPGGTALVNAQGWFLLGFERDREWGFQLGAGPGDRLRDDHTRLWQAMQAAPVGRLDTASGIHHFLRIDPARDLERSGLAVTSDAGTWYLALTIPAAELSRFRAADLARLLPLYLVALGLLGGLLWLLLRYRLQQRRNREEIRRLDRAIHRERDLFVGGPTVVFRRRNALGWPVDYVSSNVQSVLGYRPGQFLQQRLTYASIVAPEWLEPLAAGLRRTHQWGEQALEQPPYQLVTGDGRKIWVRETTLAVRAASGQVTHFYGYLNDVTDIKTIEAQLRTSRDRSQRILDTIADPTLVIDVESFRLHLANRAAREHYLQTDDALENMTCHQLSHRSPTPCSGVDDPCPVRAILEGREACQVVHRHLDAQGRSLFVEVSATPILDDTGRVVQIIESHRDITRHVELAQTLKHQAHTDGLTRIYNRRKLDLELQREIREAHREQRRFGLIMFDVDHFKQVNDRHGHDAGDRVLQQIAELVRARLRRTDLLARWGGEEFVVLSPVAEMQALAVLAEDLRAAVQAHDFAPVGQLTASFGVTLLAPGDDMERMVKRVDRALYASKLGGRNRVTALEADPRAVPAGGTPPPTPGTGSDTPVAPDRPFKPPGPSAPDADAG